MDSDEDAIKYLLSILIVNHERMRIISVVNRYFESDSMWLESRYNVKRVKWIISLVKGKTYADTAHRILKITTSKRYDTKFIIKTLLSLTNKVSQDDPMGSDRIKLFENLWRPSTNKRRSHCSVKQ